jgi:hypothetical protein
MSTLHRDLETRQTKLGADHPDTLTSMANIAFIWKPSRRLAEAMDLLRTCSAKQEQVLGLDHPDTLTNSGTLLKWETEALDAGS